MAKKYLLTVCCVVVVILGGYLVAKKSGQEPIDWSLSKVSVSARGGQFVPNRIQVGHLESINLEVLAVDHDYSFKLKEFNINRTIKKGQTEIIKIRGLGIGDYVFQCGNSCSGVLSVLSKEDAD